MLTPCLNFQPHSTLFGNKILLHETFAWRNSAAILDLYWYYQCHIRYDIDCKWTSKDIFFKSTYPVGAIGHISSSPSDSKCMFHWFCGHVRAGIDSTWLAPRLNINWITISILKGPKTNMILEVSGIYQKCQLIQMIQLSVSIYDLHKIRLLDLLSDNTGEKW